jgi:hypothetical protein
MSVNLDRLRKVWDDVGWNHREADAESIDYLHDLADAVLDAPRVWSCSLGTSYPVKPALVCDDGRHGGRCGWVVLVPVDGGEA